MATLSGTKLSKVTDIIPATNDLRFCTEYLGLKGNEYSIIKHDNNDNHHDTIYACQEKWRNKTEGAGLDASRELYNILKSIQETHGWFSVNDIESIFEEQPGKNKEEREYTYNMK